MTKSTLALPILNETLTDGFAGFMGDHQIDPPALDEDHKAWAH